MRGVKAKALRKAAGVTRPTEYAYPLPIRKNGQLVLPPVRTAGARAAYQASKPGNWAARAAWARSVTVSAGALP